MRVYLKFLPIVFKQLPSPPIVLAELAACTSPVLSPWLGGAVPCFLYSVLGTGFSPFGGRSVTIGSEPDGVVASLTSGGFTVVVGVDVEGASFSCTI